MAAVHRATDARICGAATIVANQSTVYSNDLLWAVAGDPNSHGGGALIPSGAPTVFIGGLGVIVAGDPASADGLCIPIGPPHCGPNAMNGSNNVFAGA